MKYVRYLFILILFPAVLFVFSCDDSGVLDSSQLEYSIDPEGCLWKIADHRDYDGDGVCFTYAQDAGDGIWNFDIDDGTGFDGSGNAGSLTSPPIYIPENHALFFAYWLETEFTEGEGKLLTKGEFHILDDGGGEPPFYAWDIAYIEVSTDGETWDLLQGPYPDTNGEWLEVTVPLEDYYGEYVYFRFTFDTGDDVDNDYEGWYVDAIDIVEHESPGIEMDGQWRVASDKDYDDDDESYAYNHFDVEWYTYDSDEPNTGNLVFPPTFICRGYSLVYAYWLETDEESDYAAVEASVDGGESWFLLTEEEYYSSTDGWYTEEIELEEVEGMETIVRFRFYANGDDDGYAGFYVDMVGLEFTGEEEEGD